jgi:hypothetical protein
MHRLLGWGQPHFHHRHCLDLSGWDEQIRNQKGNLSYLAGTKKRSDSLIQLIFHKRGARAGDDARALFLSNTAEERVELLRIVSHRFEEFCQQRS